MVPSTSPPFFSVHKSRTCTTSPSGVTYTSHASSASSASSSSLFSGAGEEETGTAKTDIDDVDECRFDLKRRRLVDGTGLAAVASVRRGAAPRCDSGCVCRATAVVGKRRGLQVERRIFCLEEEGTREGQEDRRKVTKLTTSIFFSSSKHFSRTPKAKRLQRRTRSRSLDLPSETLQTSSRGQIHHLDAPPPAEPLVGGAAGPKPTHDVDFDIIDFDDDGLPTTQVDSREGGLCCSRSHVARRRGERAEQVVCCRAGSERRKRHQSGRGKLTKPAFFFEA